MLIDGEEDHWLGFVHAIKNIIRQTDQNVRARFKKVNDNIQDQANKTNRLVKHQNNSLALMQKE